MKRSRQSRQSRNKPIWPSPTLGDLGVRRKTPVPEPVPSPEPASSDIGMFLAHSREWLQAYQAVEAAKTKVAEGLVEQIAGINARIDAILTAIATHGSQPPVPASAPDVHGFSVCREDVRARKAVKHRAKPTKRGPRG